MAVTSTALASTTLPVAPYFDTEQFAILGELGEGGDAEIILEIVGQFLADVSDTLQALERALAAGNFPKAAHFGHSLKGSFGTFGLMRAQMLAWEIEHQAQLGLGEGLTATYRSMLGSYLAGRQALELHLRKFSLTLR